MGPRFATTKCSLYVLHVVIRVFKHGFHALESRIGQILCLFDSSTLIFIISTLGLGF